MSTMNENNNEIMARKRENEWAIMNGIKWTNRKAAGMKLMIWKYEWRQYVTMNERMK